MTTEPAAVDGEPVDLVLLRSGPAILGERLVDGLTAQGIRLGRRTEVDVTGSAFATDLAAALAPTGRAVAVVDGSVIVNAPALGALLDDPRVATGALTVRDDGSSPPAVHRTLGVARVSASARPAAAALARDLTAAPPTGGAAATEVAGDVTAPPTGGAGATDLAGDVVTALVVGLGAAGVAVTAVPLGGYVWARVRSADDAPGKLAAVDAVDERRTRLREAARGGDGFYSTFVLRKLSWHVTGAAERLGLTPNAVTVTSFLLGLVAAALIATGDRPAMVAGAVLLQVCLVVDCVDGELARFRRRFSRFGAWLDATTDRVKEFAAVGAFAVAARSDEHALWGLAAAAIGLQTFRNLLDLGWALQRGSREAGPTSSPRWLGAATDLVTPTRAPGPGARVWARRVGHFPIGERFLLMSIGAAVLSPRLTLLLLLGFGLLAAVYLLGAFAVRSRTSTAATTRLARLADSGPVLGALVGRIGRGRAGRLAAFLPALLAAAELGLAWLLAAVLGGAAPAVVLLLVGVIAVAHYQQAYGVREERSARPALEVGSDVRLVVLLAVAVVGGPAASWVVGALALVVAVSSTGRSLVAWTGRGPDGDARPAPERPAGTTPTVTSRMDRAVGGAR